METIRDCLSSDHRACDAAFAATEQAVAAGKWDAARAAFETLREAMLAHLAAEEEILFPAFEARTGMSMGPTRVMRGEHAQMRELLEAAGEALAAQDAEDYAGNAETLLILTQQHNMKEENVLYPMCDQHLAIEASGLVKRLAAALHSAK